MHRAKIAGADATATTVNLAATAALNPRHIADIGCGRGSATIRLVHQYPSATIIAVDQSPGLLTTVARRLHAHQRRAHLVAADFHGLPLPTASLDLAVAGFCLYHSPRPDHVLTEVARCIRPGGHIIATTKSADSYHDLHTLIANSGLDPDADRRTSLYSTFHTDNAEPAITAAGLTLQRRVDQVHTFRFADLAHVAEYVATCPQYRLPHGLSGDAAALTTALRQRAADRPTTTTSTVTYLVAQRP